MHAHALTIGASSLGGAAPSYLIDQLTVKPVAAWSVGRTLSSGKAPLSGSPAAITQVLDQIGTKHATPVGFTASAADTILSISAIIANPNASAGLAYLDMDAVDDCLTLASGVTLGTQFTVAWASSAVGSGSSYPVVGKNGNSAPYIRERGNEILVRPSDTGAVTLTGDYTLSGTGAFHYTVLTYDGTNLVAYRNSVRWKAAATAMTTAGFGILDVIGKTNTSPFYNGGWGELIIFDQALTGSDLTLLMSSGLDAWRTPTFIAGDGVGSNSARGYSPSRAFANVDAFNAVTSQLSLKNHAFAIRFGADMRRSPVVFTGAGQVGVSTASPNRVINYGDIANGPARANMGTSLAGVTWTNESGNIWSTPYVLASTQRVFWLKSGYSAEALRQAWETAYTATTVGAVPTTAQAALFRGLSQAASSAVTLDQWFADGTKLYINIGQDPNGQNFESAVQNGLPTNRALQLTTGWETKLWMSFDFTAEDGVVIASNDVKLKGYDASHPFMAVGNTGDSCGGKGGTSGNEVWYFTGMYSGVADRSQTGSNGDFMSWHGGNKADLYYCTGFGVQKEAFGHEQGTTVRHFNCRWVGCNQGIVILDQGGGVGVHTFTDCDAKFTSNDGYPAVSFRSSVGPTLNLTRGNFLGAAGVTDNTWLRVYSGAAGLINVSAAPNAPTRAGYTTDVANGASGTVTVNLAA